MKIFRISNFACDCPKCGTELHFRIDHNQFEMYPYHRKFGSGTWCCSKCGEDCTEAIYGKK